MKTLTAYEKTLAGCSFMVAAALAFLSMALSESHDIAAGVLMAIAQFLLLTASILHIDYKLHQYGSTKVSNPARHTEQQSSKHSSQQ